MLASMQRSVALGFLGFLVGAAVLLGSAIALRADEIPAAVRGAVDAADRSAADRELDAGRRPDRMLAFLGIRPGMRVAELGAGGGYTAELLARAVGPSGRVYGHNTPGILERFAEAPWSARLAKPVMQNVVRLDRSFDDPFPGDVVGLDAVLLVLFYHDTVWLKVDREKMNRAVYQALAPGGIYGIVDHSAKAGTGLADAETLHRIDESVVRREVESAGFRLVGEGGFLRNPQDPRDWNASPRVAGEQRGTSDRFVLKFVKPEASGAAAE
jgi:predicted methyltransferase